MYLALCIFAEVLEVIKVEYITGNRPIGIWMSSTNHLYVTYSGDNVVKVVNTNGIVSLFAGNYENGYNGENRPPTSAKLNYPYQSLADTVGNFYISDQYNNRVRIISKSDG